MGDQVAGELAGVAPGAGEPLDGLERRARVPIGERVGGIEEEIGVGGAEHLNDLVGGHGLAAEGDQLVEGAECIAEAAGGRARDQGNGAIVDLDLLGRGDTADDLGDLLE